MRKEAYETTIEEASELLAQAVWRIEADLVPRAPLLDGDILVLIREVGRRAWDKVVTKLTKQMTTVVGADGLKVERRPLITVGTVLGRATIESPYLRCRLSKQSARPVKKFLALRGGGRTPAVERALSDFGIEDSFNLAAQRFMEHYGWEVGPTTVQRVVKSVALDAEVYVRERLDQAQQAFDEPLATRPGADKILVELDGGMIPTSTLVAAPERGLTEVRELPARRRDIAWREVRVAFARRYDELDRTYVARMDKYEPVVDSLFAAAVDRGLSDSTQVYAVSDGGIGLREALDAKFSGLRFVLDRPHLQKHLYETADAIGLVDDQRRAWVESALVLIDATELKNFFDILNAYDGSGKDRVHQLVGYLERFADAFDYSDAVEQGIPVGSGEVESAHRYIPQKRFKIPGATWHPATINPMLSLRVIRANRWWSDFWHDRNAQSIAA